MFTRYMTIQEVWNRGNNLVATAIVGLAGVSFLPEAFIEDHPAYKMDDGALFLLGIVGVVWYVTGNNKFTRSIIPPILVTVGFIIKVGGLIMEFADKDDAGDDFGGVILFVLATILVWYLYIMAPKIIKKFTK